MKNSPIDKPDWPRKEKEGLSKLLKSRIKEGIINDLTEIKRVTQKYYEQLYAMKIHNVDDSGQIPRRTQTTKMTWKCTYNKSWIINWKTSSPKSPAFQYFTNSSEKEKGDNIS